MRYWRVAANFHRIGDVVVTVTSPNWQGAIRKAAIALKRLPVMKGKRMNSASFMLAEVEAPVIPTTEPSQLVLPEQQAEQQVEIPTTTSEPGSST